MLLELYSIFEELEIIQNCTKYSFIDFVVANKVTTANDLIVFPKEPTKVIYKNFYLKKDTTHLDSLLKSDLGIIIKYGSHKDRTRNYPSDLHSVHYRQLHQRSRTPSDCLYQ